VGAAYGSEAYDSGSYRDVNRLSFQGFTGARRAVSLVVCSDLAHVPLWDLIGFTALPRDSTGSIGTLRSGGPSLVMIRVAGNTSIRGTGKGSSTDSLGRYSYSGEPGKVMSP
jgi:hypothetical protein